MSDWLGVIGIIKFVGVSADDKTEKARLKHALNQYLRPTVARFTESVESTFEWDFVINTECKSISITLNASLIDRTLSDEDVDDVRQWLKEVFNEQTLRDNGYPFGGLYQGVVSLSNYDNNDNVILQHYQSYDDIINVETEDWLIN